MAVPGRNPNKFTIETNVSGDITKLTLHGTLDHGFDAQAMTKSIATSKLVLDMHDVRRFASWGMSEWMDFLRHNAQRDIYLVECSAYTATQLNLVTGLVGHAKLVSFYIPFRCGSCGEEFETMVLVPKDRDHAAELALATQPCTTCGKQARLEEHSASVVASIAQKPPFDIDDEVLGYFRAHLEYDLPLDLTRFRAHYRAKEPYAYFRLSGSLASFAADRLIARFAKTTVLDVAKVTAINGNIASWRELVDAARTKTQLQLVACPREVFETAVDSNDLRAGVKVRTLVLDYECQRCEVTTSHEIDVAENLEFLAQGTAPTVVCRTCNGALNARLSAPVVEKLRLLPARERDAQLDAFLAKARAEPTEKLDDALAPIPVHTPSKVPVGLIAGGVLVLAAGGVAAFALMHNKSAAPVATTTPVATPSTGSQTQQQQFVRPDWILSDVPSSAYCHDLVNRVMCVGVSSYKPTREDAVAEANDAALEELVSAVGLKISDPFFKSQILSAYSTARSKKLTALQDADTDRQSPAYVAASGAVTSARRRVVEVLQATGGAAVPSRRTDWYWEEYAKKGGGTEQLVFVRYDVTLDAVRGLVDTYSQAVAVGDGSALTVFPELAWAQPELTGGAIVEKPGKLGVESGAIVTSVAGKPITDAAALAQAYAEGKGALPAETRAADGSIKTVEIHGKAH